MAVSRLLAVVNGTPESRSVMQAAVALGKKQPCLIDGLHVQSDADVVSWVGNPLYTGSMPVEVVNQLKKDQEERAKTALDIFDSETGGIPRLTNGHMPKLTETHARWEDAHGDHWRTIARKGRAHDLIILPRPTPGHWEAESHEAEAALFDSGHGVLIVPHENPDMSAQHVAVAWTDSPETARSIAAAEPFLREAEKVSVIAVTKDKDRPEGLKDIEEYFINKDIDAQVFQFIHDGTPVADQILDSVADIGADFLVMGAYGHSRLREMVLGGATRGVLRDTDIPVLMAH